MVAKKWYLLSRTLSMNTRKFITTIAIIITSLSLIRQSLPSDSLKPWVVWFWINDNISLEGIAKDLEAMKEVGINGFYWMAVSGPWWAPEGLREQGN
jgi:hypothetical protein